MSHKCDNRRIEGFAGNDSFEPVASANKTRWAAIVAIWIMTATFARAGEGQILKPVVNPALAAQRTALANQAHATQALQALQSATQTYQASGIRGGGVMSDSNRLLEKGESISQFGAGDGECAGRQLPKVFGLARSRFP
jgi:hypothetical protein